MEQRYLIDSNALIDYLSGKIPAKAMSFMNHVINGIPNISIISKIEVLGYNTTPDAYELLSGFINDSLVIGLSDDIVNQTIELRKNKKIKTPDAIIAATALVNEYSLITHNTKDFDNIQGLKVVNPYQI